jgi:hypothetical protein
MKVKVCFVPKRTCNSLRVAPVGKAKFQTKSREIPKEEGNLVSITHAKRPCLEL